MIRPQERALWTVEVRSFPFAGSGVDPCYACGLCAASCPIKRLVDPEFDPRRFVRSVAFGEGERLLQSEKIWLCLLCGTCSYFCPRGVKPSEVIAFLRQKALRTGKAKVEPFKKVAYELFIRKRANLERALLLYGRSRSPLLLGIIKRLALVPEGGKALMEIVEPLRIPTRRVLPDVVPAEGKPLYKVAYFLGCANNVLFSEVAKATVRLLSLNGCEVHVPKGIQCCGMPFLGYTDLEKAKDLARHNIRILEALKVDFIITDCATCGAFLHRYGELLADDPAFCLRARAISDKTRDVTFFFFHLLPWDRHRPSLPLKVTYHDPCHLRKEQKVWAEPRQLLQEACGLQLVEMAEPDLCCGGAGTYGVFNFEESMKVLDQKMEGVKKTGAEVLASGCPGCMLQLKLGAKRKGLSVKVKHPVELLSEAHR